MSNKLIDLIRSYQHHHQKKSTIFSHFVGIPLLTLATLILFNWVKISVPGFFTLSVAWIGVIVLAIYYFTLDLLIGAATTLMLIVFCAITSIFTADGPSTLSLKLFVIIFTLGAIFQLIGYVFEGKKPLFFNNLLCSVIMAPFFITANTLLIFGLKEDLRKQIKTKYEQQGECFDEDEIKLQ